MADAGKLQVELEAGHAVVGAAQFEIHVAEMVFAPDDVGQQFVTFQLSILAMLRDEADGNSGDRCLYRHAGVHKRKHSATDARHRGRSVRFHDFARNTNGITEIVLARHHRLKRTLRQCSVADLAT